MNFPIIQNNTFFNILSKDKISFGGKKQRFNQVSVDNKGLERDMVSFSGTKKTKPGKNPKTEDNKKETEENASGTVLVDIDDYNDKVKKLLTKKLGYDVDDRAINDIEKGNYWKYGIDLIEYQSIKNSAFIETFEKDNLLEIGGNKRKIYVTSEQKKIYDKCKHEIDKSFNDEYCKDVLMTDVMFFEAIAICAGYDVENKTSEEIFQEIRDKYLNQESYPNELAEAIGASSDELKGCLEAYIVRDSLSETIETATLKSDEKAGIKEITSGDKAVHELNKAMAQKFDTDPKFREEFTKYCQKSEKYKEYAALYDMYKEDLRTQMKNISGYSGTKVDDIIKNKVKNENHIISRAVQRDAMADFDSIKRKDFMDITGDETKVKTLSRALAEKLLEEDVKDDRCFMGRFLTTEGEKVYHTIEYSYKDDKEWGISAVYVPKAS